MSYKYDVFVLSEKLYWKNTHSHINDAKFNDKKNGSFVCTYTDKAITRRAKPKSSLL